MTHNTHSSCPLPPGARVAAYLRDSGGPAQGEPVDQQLAAVVQYCRDNNLALDPARVYADRARPGSTVNQRDEFNRLRADAERSAIAEGISLWSSAGFARDLGDSKYYRALLRKLGYTLIYIADDIPLDPRIAPLVETMIEIRDQEYLSSLSREVRRGHPWVLEQGGWLGTVAVGYRAKWVQVGLRRNGKPRPLLTLEADPKMAPGVVRAFELRPEGRSYQAFHKPAACFQRTVSVVRTGGCSAIRPTSGSAATPGATIRCWRS